MKLKQRWNTKSPPSPVHLDQEASAGRLLIFPQPSFSHTKGWYRQRGAAAARCGQAVHNSSVCSSSSTWDVYNSSRSSRSRRWRSWPADPEEEENLHDQLLSCMPKKYNPTAEFVIGVPEIYLVITRDKLWWLIHYWFPSTIHFYIFYHYSYIIFMLWNFHLSLYNKFWCFSSSSKAVLLRQIQIWIDLFHI